MNNITLPVLIFGSMIAGLIGSLIHLVLGGKPLRLIFSVVLSWLGFWIGNNLAMRMQITIFMYGALHLGLAVFSSIGFGLIGYWLSGENQKV